MCQPPKRSGRGGLPLRLAEFRSRKKQQQLGVSENMATRLTDKQRKRVIADYVECGSYNAVAKKYGIARQTVKNIVSKDAEVRQNLQAKKEQNTADILAHMAGKRDTVCKIVDEYLDALLDADRLERANPAQITTAMGTVIDKFASLDDKAEDRADLARMTWVSLWENISPSFYPLVGDIFAHGHSDYDISGGRMSAKSAFVSLVVVMLVMTYPEIHALVLRKVGNTMRGSVFEQYMWAIDKLGAASVWESKVNPLELIYKPTGQKIMFRGADDPMKIKSIKTRSGYIAITHFEEKDQFAGRSEIRAILQSTRRGGERFWNFESYNPPISRDNWANKDSLEEVPGRLRHKSTYLEVPAAWIGEQALADAERLKETDERAYQHEYLGIATGTGGNVFENLELREITDSEVRSFDRIYQGVDWGFYPDAFAFIRMHYDKARETIYLLDEYYAHKQSNETTGAWIRAKGYTDSMIICDSAEPKSVADYRAIGLPAQSALKGPGSLDYSMKWLARRKIVIDRRRTPHAYAEFVNYEYERNKDGEIISGYPDANDHCISGVRYGLEPAYRKMGVIA